MKRLAALLLALMLGTGACLAEALPTFAALTGFDAFEARLAAGDEIESVYYTDGFGFSTSEFTTTDPDEIAALIDALGQIEVVARTDEAITDWYPQIVFKLGEDDWFRVSFNKQWLMIDGMDNYVVEGDGPFWALTAELVQKYMPE